MDEVLRPLGSITPQYSVQCAIDAEPGGMNAGLARAAFVTAQTCRKCSPTSYGDRNRAPRQPTTKITIASIGDPAAVTMTLF